MPPGRGSWPYVTPFVPATAAGPAPLAPAAAAADDDAPAAPLLLDALAVLWFSNDMKKEVAEVTGKTELPEPLAAVGSDHFWKYEGTSRGG